MHVLGAENPTRSNILPVMDDAALFHREAPIVTRAHRTELAMKTHLLPFEACSLPGIEPPIADAVSNPSLLVELALHNRVLLLCGRSGLSESDGRRCNQGRHKYELCESHGVSPSVTAVT
jgi:hypothetical protein